jgi:hypothetical protein
MSGRGLHLLPVTFLVIGFSGSSASAEPVVLYREPVTLSTGLFEIDETDHFVDFGASGPGANVALRGFWHTRSLPVISETFVDDPSFSGDMFIPAGSSGEVRLKGRILSFEELDSPWTLTVAITGLPRPLPPEEGGAVTVRFPGVFSGSLSGAFDQQEFTIPLRGSGTGFLSFAPTTGGFRPIASAFTFQDAAAVPEPGTILLLSAGAIAGLARRRWQP